MNYDTQSCAGGVHDSLYVLSAIDSGASTAVNTAISVANLGSTNCQPSNNDLLANLLSEQPSESLSSYHLDRVIPALLTWAAVDATAVQSDVATVLTDLGKPSDLAARAALANDLARLDRQRAAVKAVLAPAVKALHPKTSLLALPG